MGNSAKRDARKADHAERQRAALELRRQGFSYPQIATELGYSHASAASKAVKAAIKEIIREPAQEVLSLELERLDAMLRGIVAGADAGDTQAIDRALKIMDRRARYLGLDSPAKHEVSAPMTPEQARERYRELTGHEWKDPADD